MLCSLRYMVYSVSHMFKKGIELSFQCWWECFIYHPSTKMFLYVNKWFMNWRYSMMLIGWFLIEALLIIENYCFVRFAVHLAKIFLDVAQNKTYVISICSTVNHELFSKWYEITNNFSWIWFNSLKNHRMWCHRSMRTVIIICNNLVVDL